MTPDFLLGQLRLALVAFLSFAVGKGWLTSQDSSAITQMATALGPIAVIWGWSLYRNFNTKFVPGDSIAISPHTPQDAMAPIGSNAAGKVVGALMFALCVSALMTPAFAADNLPLPALITKGNAATTCTPTSCTGFYGGFGIGGNGGNLDIIGQGINGSVFAGGSIPAFDAGYLYKSGAWMLGAEFTAGYQLNSGVAINGLAANENGFVSTQVIRAGGDLAALFGGQSPITIPPQLASALISPYVQIGIAEHQMAGFWASGMVSGAGALFDIGPHTFIDLDYKHINYTGKTGFISPGAQDVVSIKLNYKF